LIGISVLLIDLVKGLLVVYIAKLLVADNFETPAFSLVAAVFGHNYSPWIKFKGGRGLATAAGGTLLFTPLILISWMFLWIVSYLLKKNIHFSNIIATFLTALLGLSSITTFAKYSFPESKTLTIYAIYLVLLLLLIMLRHIEPLRIFIEEQKKSLRSKNYENQ